MLSMYCIILCYEKNAKKYQKFLHNIKKTPIFAVTINTK